MGITFNQKVGRNRKTGDMKTKPGLNHSRLTRKAKRAWKVEKLSPQTARVGRSSFLPKLKRILVPTDFSEASLKALRYAVPFAERFGATIFLVHVIEPSFFAGDDQNLAPAGP